MGCKASKSTFDTSQLGDSIHTLLERERRQAAKNGEQLPGYRPRAPLSSQIKLTKLIKKVDISPHTIISEEVEEDTEDSMSVDLPTGSFSTRIVTANSRLSTLDCQWIGCRLQQALLTELRFFF
jgi:hypothetical protein